MASGRAAAAAISGEPAAVLLVDVGRREVVHANDVAQQLAPEVALPASLDHWSDAAVLRDPEGRELSDSSHPLSRIARSEPVEGTAVTAGRASLLGEQRTALWVVALPMAGAPQVEDLALVVLLPLHAPGRTSTDGPPVGTTSPEERAAQAGAAAQVELREQAVLATGISFTVADARHPDQPLVWVNPAFTVETGYTAQDVVGRNCRFLQGDDTDPAAVAELRKAIDGGQPATVTLLNYRKDGTAFWNQVSLSPIRDGGGALTHYVGIQSDVTARMESDAVRDRALAAERTARLEAERAHAQLALLAEATSQLSATLDEVETLTRLSRLSVPVLADWTAIVTLTEDGQVERTVSHDRYERTAPLERLMGLVRDQVPASVNRTLLRTARPTRVSALARSETLLRRLPSPMQDALGELQVRDALLIPLLGRDRVLGVLALCRSTGEDYTDADLSVAADLGRRAGLALDNARLYAAEHRVAETLQRSLLPVLPQVPGMRASATYQAGESAAAVGGDFYEVLALPDGSTMIAIGDVVGHDVLAAAAMGHLRGLLRATAWDSASHDDDAEPDGLAPTAQSRTTSPTTSRTTSRARSRPGAVLARVDRLLQGLDGSTLATAALLRVERLAGGDQAGAGGWLLSSSSAGHPPVLLRLPDGTVDSLDAEDGVMLGVTDLERTTHERTVPDGTLVLCYTDGLVERRGEHLEVGLARLRQLLAAAPAEPDRVCDVLPAELGRSDDDVAVLAVLLHDPDGTASPRD